MKAVEFIDRAVLLYPARSPWYHIQLRSTFADAEAQWTLGVT